LQFGENFWESYDLSKIDLSNNQIVSIPDEIASQAVSKLLTFFMIVDLDDLSY
jgi:hypothetical protein